MINLDLIVSSESPSGIVLIKSRVQGYYAKGSVMFVDSEANCEVGFCLKRSDLLKLCQSPVYKGICGNVRSTCRICPLGI